MLIVSDAHIDPAFHNIPAFWKLLQQIEKTDHDVVFLGDIFDLWIALPRYETIHHHRFLAWCRRERRRRTVGFVTGNHEFYLGAHRADAFSWYATACRVDGDAVLFCHGDLINDRDLRYLRFRSLVRSPVVRGVLAALPFRGIAHFLKRRLKTTNSAFRKRLPEAEIACFADRHFSRGVHTIFAGHFHQAYQYVPNLKCALHVLPDWHRSHTVALFEPASRRVTYRIMPD